MYTLTGLIYSHVYTYGSNLFIICATFIPIKVNKFICANPNSFHTWSCRLWVFPISLSRSREYHNVIRSLTDDRGILEILRNVNTRVKRRVQLMEHELVTLPEHLMSCFSVVRVDCVVFWGSLFVLLFFLFWSLYCLYFYSF